MLCVVVFCVLVLFLFNNCHYAEFLMLNMPSFIMLGFVILCVVLSLLAPSVHSKFSY
jgi:hypothetical protein